MILIRGSYSGLVLRQSNTQDKKDKKKNDKEQQKKDKEDAKKDKEDMKKKQKEDNKKQKEDHKNKKDDKRKDAKDKKEMKKFDKTMDFECQGEPKTWPWFQNRGHWECETGNKGKVCAYVCNYNVSKQTVIYCDNGEWMDSRFAHEKCL